MWRSVSHDHKWNIEKFEYRTKSDREIYPYTREELFEEISKHGSNVMAKSTGNVFYIADVLSDHQIRLRRSRWESEKCISYQDFADGYLWDDDVMQRTPCGWDSNKYEIVEEPVIHQGVQWGTERVVKKIK